MKGLSEDTIEALRELGVDEAEISEWATKEAEEEKATDGWLIARKHAAQAVRAPAMTMEKAFNTLDKRMDDLDAECRTLHRELAYVRLPVEDQVLMALNRQPRAVHVSPTMCKATLAADDAPRSGAAELVETVQRLVENVAQSRYQV